jgi:hypothetical protein
MQMNLEIDNNFFPHFKAMIDSFVKDNKVSVVEIDDYDYTKNAPESVIVSSVEEVRRRVALAEAEESMTEEEYEVVMNKFFKEELGVER